MNSSFYYFISGKTLALWRTHPTGSGIVQIESSVNKVARSDQSRLQPKSVTPYQADRATWLPESCRLRPDR